ncbi:MAG: TPM domain-containing protein [Acidobacteria bacterium]|nr:TPM domain-containing protein [Acidobacteriota bacterium]
MNVETRLREFRDSTGVEISVAVVRTTGERDIFDYSLAVARGWGIGLDQDDNPAALLFIAVDDRKYFTHVSKDLEDELPDGLVGDLQRRYLVPEFRKGNYGKGIADTVEMYIRTYENGSSARCSHQRCRITKAKRGSAFRIFCCLAIMLFLILVAWSNRSKRGRSDDDNDRWGGGGSAGVVHCLDNSRRLGGSSSDSSSSWDWGGGGGSDWGALAAA